MAVTAPRGPFGIEPNAVHVWRFDLDRPAQDYSILSPAERARAVRLVNARDRRRFRAAHVAVRQIVGRYTDALPHTLVFADSGGGKPHLILPEQRGISFSLSHSGACGLLAVASDRAVGADIEMMRPLDDLAGMAKQIMSDSEWSCFQTLLTDPGYPGPAHDVFFTLWVRKEAILKAIGTGFLTDPRALHLGLTQGESSLVWQNTTWSVMALDAGPTARAAVAALGNPPVIKVKVVPPEGFNR